VRSVQRSEYQAELRGEAADWLRRHLPPGTRVGAWNGGMLGYYSGQHVVILDGLANSSAFYTAAPSSRRHASATCATSTSSIWSP